MHLPLLGANALLVGGQAVLMLMEVPLWYLFELLLFTAVLVLNGKELLPYVKRMLFSAKKK